jgi:putative transcriptional regulator
MSMNFDKFKKPEAERGYLDGQIIVAMPSLVEPFARSVVYICAHSSEGAMGLIVNQPAPDMKFPDLLVQLDIIASNDVIVLPERAQDIRVLRGGPVDAGRGFVLHSDDFRIENSTLPLDTGICLTATIDILRAIARGEGPNVAMLALGYAGWAAGQLENEIRENGWLHCPPDLDLIFDRDLAGKYDRAMRKIGINPAMLSDEAGHA